MSSLGKVTAEHLDRMAYLYVRQSSLHQVQEHRESTARQYDLKRRAQALGWSQEQIEVVDEDLGRSGASAVERSGFQRMVADVGLGRVGVVMGLEVSRLARNCTDWHRLLEICALSDTLILDEDGIYDPGHFNDRLLLGLKGTMSEAELHMLRARLLGGQLNKARRGELWMNPPIGYLYDQAHHCLALDPDAQIQGAVRLLFEAFRHTGSAGQVVRHFRREQIGWPRRIRTGARTGEIVWGALEHHRVLQVLHNPRYAGAFVYGRTRQRKVFAGGQPRYRRLPRSQWKVFIPGIHPGYIPWEEFETNQATLLANANAYGLDRRKSPPREGVALLQGCVLCGRCGLRMSIRYVTRAGHPSPDYTCQRRGIQSASGLCCQVVAGAEVDRAVSEMLLQAVTPAALDIALEVFAELRQRQAAVDRQRRAQVERVREAAELAQRQFMLVRPENRLVADRLEQQWNERLAGLAQAEQEYARATEAEPAIVTEETRARIHALVSDLPQVWNDPRTAARERKRLLRLLIEDVTLIRDQSIQIKIRWKGGATSEIERPLPKGAPDLRRTPAAIVEQVRALSTERTDAEIADALNARYLRTGTGQSFTRLRVRYLREQHGIASLAEHLRRTGWLTVPEVAAQLGVCTDTAKRFAAGGLLLARRGDDRGGILFAPLTGALPKAHPGKRFRDRCHYPKLASHRRQGLQYEA